MNIKELDRKSGFSKSQMLIVLKDEYQNQMYNIIKKLIKNPDCIDMDMVWELVSKRIFCVDINCDLYYVVYDCVRKYVLKSFQDGIGVPCDNQTLLIDYFKNKKVNLIEDEKNMLIKTLSFFSRKEFDYLINRYYLFDMDISYNQKIESQIKKIFLGKGKALPLKWTNQKCLDANNTEYVRYLEDLSEFYLKQIGRKDNIQIHQLANEFFVLKQRYQARRIALPVILMIFIITLIAMFVYFV